MMCMYIQYFNMLQIILSMKELEICQKNTHTLCRLPYLHCLKVKQSQINDVGYLEQERIKCISSDKANT